MATDKSGWVVGKVLAEQAQTRGEKPFIQFEKGHMYTYSEAHKMGNRAGNGYAAVGI